MALLNNMQTSRLFILISVAILIFTLVTVGLIWWPKYQEFSVKTSDLLAKKEQKKEKDAYVSKLNDYDSELSNYTEQLSKINMAFPSNIEDGVGSFLTFIYGAASENGVLVNETKWNVKAEKNSKIAEAVFENSGLASYESIKKLIDRLYKNSRLVRLTALNITESKDKAENAQEFRMSLLVNFQNNKKSVVDEKAAAAK